MIKILDISGHASLVAEDARKLNKIAERLRHPFVKLVSNISLPKKNNIDWWVTPLATRNTFSSPFFLDCCRVQLLNDLLANPNGLDAVIVGSPGMLSVARNLIKIHHSTCQIKFDRIRYFREIFFRFARNLFGATIQSLSQFIFANVFAKDVSLNHAKSLIIIDTFLYPNSIKDGKFEDRHFPGIDVEFDSDELNRVRYFPTFYGTLNFFTAFLRLKQQKTNFIFKEHYLRVNDYFFAIGHTFRVGLLKSDSPLFLDEIDVSPIANDNLGMHCSPPSVIEALLKYRSISRMRDAGIRVDRVIDWFENQDIDRGAIAGFRQFFPNSSTVGYIGYVPSNFFPQPTEVEISAGVIPTKIFVMGRGFFDSLTEFAPNLNLDVAPALRYQHLFRKRMPRIESKNFRILVALPVIRSEAKELVASLRSAIPEILAMTESAVKVVIKPHPTAGIVPLDLSSLSDIPEVFFEVAEGRLDLLLPDVDVMISSASSACFEALLFGVPTVIMGSLNGLTYITIPQGVPKNLWKLYYPGEKLSAVIKKLLVTWSSGYETDVNLLSGLQEIYIEPVTRNGIRRLILGSSI